LSQFGHLQYASLRYASPKMPTIPDSSRPSSTLRFLRLLLGILGFLILLTIFCALNVGRWLVSEDPLGKAQAIVVLSGRLPVRALAAARLYHDGFAPEIWLTRPAEPGASLAALQIPYDDEAVYNTRVLLREGVPPQAIRVLPDPIVNTADEMAEIAAALPAGQSATIIIVTTKAHTRRTRALWKHAAGPRSHAIVRGAPNDPFDPAHWWRTSGDALDVVRECLGLLNAWSGLPLHGS
jgi:uncharacterized SAM-binding protein YcdF (DUF218 family)